MDQPDLPPVAPSPAPAPMKFSRYRSVRRAAKNPQEITSPVAPLPLHSYPPPPPSPRAPPSPRDSTMAANTPTTIQRSMSRYRRQRAPPSSSSSESTPLPPVPATGLSDAPARGTATNPATSRPTSREVRRRAPVPNPFIGEGEEDETELERQREQHRQNAMSKLTGETPKPTRPTPRPATREKGVKHREDRSRQADRHPEDRPRRPSHNQQPQSQPQQPPSRRSWKEMAKSLRPKEKRDSGEHTATRFPGLDAPVSAVNAGERKVTVQYKKMSTDLTVLPSTSVQDLLFSAAETLTSDIDPVKFILMESFAELGLERPLRRYESIRDVLNSWAHDSENVLIVVPPASLDALALLDAHRVPTQHPSDVTLHLYYSQRPRKWDKRYITLQADGQITVAKKEDSQEQANVCHLSDFDIYSPTASFLSHNVKPPKKICHAVKSQQKSSMFLSTENFVHFFATNDRAIADRWYRAVQTWRSWYMVHTLGAGQEEQVDSPTEQTRQPSRPLLNMTHGESFNSEDSASPALDRSKSTRTKDLFARKKSTREHAPPPPALPKSLADDPDTTPDAPGDSPFISTGLLGRTYTLLQRAMKEREDREKKAAEEPFVAQGLVGTMSAHPSRPNTRSNTMTSTRAPPDTSDLMKRSQSQKVKPLVDLTPVYQEPPQHIRKGKGVTVEPGQPLIDSATGLDSIPGGIAIPPATTWRRQPPPPPIPDIPADINLNGNVNAIRTRQRSNTARSTSNHRPHRIQTSTAPTSPIDAVSPRGEEAFVPNSLLARSALQGQCGTIRGHGVATGDRNAAKPMLNVSPENPFAEGSLLRGL